MSNTDRFEYIDIAKGILIILVVLGHGLQMNAALNSIALSLIYTVHMPAFFILSGILFNADKWHSQGHKKFIISRIKSLIVPWAIFETFAIFLRLSLSLSALPKINITVIIHNLINLLTNSFPLKLWTNCGANWFLISLFFAQVLLFFITQRSRHEQILLMSFLIFISFVCKYYQGIPGINWIGRTIVATVFVEIGFTFRSLFYNTKRIYILPSLLIIALCSYINGVPDLSSFNIRYILVFVFGGISGAIFTICVSHLLGDSFLSTIGHKSLIIMGTHQLVKYYITAMYPSYWTFSIYNLAIYLILVVLLELIAIPVVGFILKRLTN